MCGIAGFIGNIELSTKSTQECLNKMRQRGPDNQSIKKYHYRGKNICYLLHSRLSIIDLNDRSNQPFEFNDITITYNGEIYNYLELRKQLESVGYKFSTASDTEVLIKSYHFWGENMFDKLEGMWSFAIYNRKTGRLILSRDRFAEKPLYYLKNRQGIYFGSEIKFIESLLDNSLEINYDQINRYIVNGYKSLYKHEETFFKKVNEVNYASYIIIDENLKLKQKKYWQLKSNIQNNLTYSDAVKNVKELLIESVKLRLRSDVPIAFCLSGGVDSSSLASVASKILNRKISTYSIIDNDDRYNEFENISATLNDLNCEHSFIHVNEIKNMNMRLKKLISYHDGPVATISYLVHSLLSENISKNGYRISISGTGADELLTGYYDHFNLHLYSVRGTEYFKQKYSEWEKHIKPIVRNPYLKNPNLYIDDYKFRSHIYFDNKKFREYLKADFEEDFIEVKYADDLLHNRMMNELFHEGTRVLVHEDDLNSMMNSIENRSPFLDRKLAEFCYTIPTHLLIKRGFGKIILRDSMKGILNDKVRLDTHKKGFNASIKSLFDFKNKNLKEEIMDQSKFFELVDREKVEKLINKDFFKNSESKLLFNILNVKYFLDGR